MATTTQIVRALSACSAPIAPTSTTSQDGDKVMKEDAAAAISSERSVFEECIVGFPDQGHWLIKKPLSQVTLQREDSPCEAKQVFSAVDVKDTSDLSLQGEEAVIKIRFQVHATEEMIDEYYDDIDTYTKDLVQNPKEADKMQKIIAEL